MRKIIVQIVILFITLFGLVACSKNDSGRPNPTYMRWINVTPNMGFDIYSNTEKIASNLIYDTLTNYASGMPGFYNLQIVKAGSADTLISGRQQLISGNYYSMFLLPDTTGGQINTNKATVSIVTENTSVPVTDTMKLRFFNFAPFSTAVNVVMSRDGSTLTADTLRPFLRRIYNDQSYQSGYSVYGIFFAANWKINLYDANSNAFLDSFHYQFASNGIYTMYLKPANNKNKFTYKVIKRGF